MREAAAHRVGEKPNGPASWTPKEELGHLIDSAANNHQRFVRAALDGEYAGPGYAQNAWVAIHGYRDMPWNTLVGFWFDYNQLLAGVIENIPSEKLAAPCSVGSGQPVTLGFLITDYVKHMQHHLDHILAREMVTPYP